MKSSCLPNYEQKIVRISALQYTGQKSWQFIVHTFGKNDDFTNSFWSLLTFSTTYVVCIAKKNPAGCYDIELLLPN